MSNEFNVAVKLQADASQYTAEFTRAGRTAAAFAAELNGGSSAAAGGLDKATAQAQRFGATASAAASQAQQGMAAATSATQALDTAVAKVNKTASSTQLGASLGAVAKESQSATQALGAADRQARALGISAKQTAAAMRGVPAQITDIVVGLQGGQAPMTVLLQQGGQLKDMFGGIVPAVRALGTAALGLLNPFVIAGGVAAALALAYKQGSAEADEFRRAIVMSGNAAGTSVGQLSDMARAVSANIGTQSQAAAVLAQMASGGRIAGDNLQYFTEVAMGLERYVGVPVKATIGDLEELGKAPLAASVKLNEQYRYLTVAVYEQIKALNEQGRTEEAASVAQNAYAKAFESRKNEMKANLGYLERAWYSLGSAAKWSWDQILNVGRATTDQQNLEQLKENLARLQERNSRPGFKEGKQTQDLKDQIKALEQKISGERQVAEEQGKQSKQTELRAEWDKVVLANLSKEKKLAQEIAEIRGKGAAAGIDKAEIEKQVKAHQEKNADKSTSSAAAAAEKDALQARIEATRQGYKLLAAETADGLDAIDALRQQGLLSEYAALQRSTALRLQEIDAHKAALNAELNELQGRKNMARERAAIEGQLAELEQKRINLQNASARDLDTLLIKPQLTLVANMRQGATAVNEQAAALEAQNRVYGLAGSALADLNIAQLEQQRLDLEATDNVIPGYIAALEDRIAAQKRLRAAMADKEAKDWAKEQAEAAVKANDRATQAIERQNEQLAQSLTDNLMRGGKKGAEYIEDYFRSLVLRPTIQALMSPVAGAVNSMVGGAMNSLGLGQVAGQAGQSILGNVGSSLISSGLGSTIAGGIGSAVGSIFGVGAGNVALGTSLGLGVGSSTAAATAAAAAGGAGAGAAGATAMGSALSSAAMAIPYIGAIIAIASILSGMDDSGTYHTGGAAQYSADKGLSSGQSGANFDIGFGRVEAGEQTISAVGTLAKGLGEALDGIAVSFGQSAGYEIATAFADDTSKDGAWGALRISKGGKELLNWDDTRMSKWAPKDFADGEEGYKQYLAAVAKDTRQVLLGMDLPSWANETLEALGDTPSMDELTAVITQIGAIQTAFEQLGMGIKGFADMTDEAFAAIMKASGGIDALNSNASAYYNLFYSETERRDATRRQISNRFSDLGLQAINYDAADAQAQFRALVDQQMALANQQLDASGETSTAASETVAGLLALANSFAQVTTAAQEATAATEQAARKQATDAALSALQRAATAAREVAQLEADLWQERVDAARAVVEASRDAVRELRAETASTAAMSAAAANAYIDQVLGNAQAASYLPDAEEWGSAISAARAGITPGSYSNRLDYEAAQLQLANRIEAVGDIGQQQLTTDELLLEQAKAEVDRLDELYKTAQEDLAVQRGTQEAVLDVATAVREFQAAMLAEREGSASASGGGTGASSGNPFVIGGGNSGSSSAPVVDTNRPGAVGENGNYRREIPLYAGLSAWNTVDDQDQAHLERIAAIAAQFEGTGDVRGLVEATRAAGGSLGDLATVGGYYLADVNRVASDLGIPAFDVGINRVPYDMDARIHQDELIVPAKFNPFNPGASSPWGASEGGGSADVVAAISALQAQHYLVGRSMLDTLKTMETLARKNEAVGVKVRTE